MCISCVEANKGQEDVEMEVLLNMFDSEARFLRVHNRESIPKPVKRLPKLLFNSYLYVYGNMYMEVHTP